MCARLCLLSLSLHGNRLPLSAAILYIYISREENGQKRRSHGAQTMYDVPFGLLPLVLERLRSEGRPLVTVLAECGALSVPLGVTFQNAPFISSGGGSVRACMGQSQRTEVYGTCTEWSVGVITSIVLCAAGIAWRRKGNDFKSAYVATRISRDRTHP